MMVKVVETLEQDYIPYLSASDPQCGRAACSVNRITGGTSANIIPDTCAITVDRRVSPRESVEGILKEVEGILENLRRSNPGWVIEQGKPRFSPPLSYDPADPFVAGVLKVLPGLGLSGTGNGAPFGTDAGTFAQAGLSCVVLGPGDPSKAHQADECIEVEQVTRGVGVLESIIGMTL
jgi:acetylornithine deacetylase/succinyl-diaminopimelate desuccinylase-like protein